MARPRQSVQESLRSLKELEAEYEGAPQLPRLTMLRLLKEKPLWTFGDVAARLGRSERSVQRWWGLYQERGINGLVDIGKAGGKRPRRVGSAEIDEIRKKIQESPLSNLAEVQRWLHEQYNIEYSRSGVRHLMRNAVGAHPRGWVMLNDDGDFANRSSANSSQNGGNYGFPEHVISFLNRLPVTGVGREWFAAFREALGDVFGDIDRITINVNTECNLNNPEDYEPGTIITQNTVDESKVAVVSLRQITEHSKRILDDMKHQGYPFSMYHPPYSFDYHYKGQAYLGTLILWRAVEKPPIFEKTLGSIKALEPFLIFSLSDMVARHQLENPIDSVFNDALNAMISDAHLTSQEQRVVVLQLLGHSYSKMADLLFVTVDNIKKHFKNIHRKTGTKGQAELFAKYFTSRLRLTETEQDLNEDDE